MFEAAAPPKHPYVFQTIRRHITYDRFHHSPLWELQNSEGSESVHLYCFGSSWSP